MSADEITAKELWAYDSAMDDVYRVVGEEMLDRQGQPITGPDLPAFTQSGRLMFMGCWSPSHWRAYLMRLEGREEPPICVSRAFSFFQLTGARSASEEGLLVVGRIGESGSEEFCLYDENGSEVRCTSQAEGDLFANPDARK